MVRTRRKGCRRSGNRQNCDFCLAHRLPCVSNQIHDADSGNYQAVIPISVRPAQKRSGELPPPSVCEDAIRLYFRHIHGAFHVIFHPASFAAAAEDGTLPRILLFAVLGLSARFSEHTIYNGTPRRERGRQFVEEAERLLDFHDVSITTIQACILIGALAIVEGEGHTESVYYSMACRMAMHLDLARMQVKSRLQQEIYNRGRRAVSTLGHLLTEQYGGHCISLIRGPQLPCACRKHYRFAPYRYP
jgi:hypothetical protein